jgi:hypothetical protein
MMVSSKVVTPVKTGVQNFCNAFKIPGFRIGSGMTDEMVFSSFVVPATGIGVIQNNFRLTCGGLAVTMQPF